MIFNSLILRIKSLETVRLAKNKSEIINMTIMIIRTSLFAVLLFGLMRLAIHNIMIITATAAINAKQNTLINVYIVRNSLQVKHFTSSFICNWIFPRHISHGISYISYSTWLNPFISIPIPFLSFLSTVTHCVKQLSCTSPISPIHVQGSWTRCPDSSRQILHLRTLSKFWVLYIVSYLLSEVAVGILFS